jgi:NAD(P)-dependent dehydrogenase (short-subunit alcohol dehydrogenase family)
MKSAINLQGKRTLITGGTSGIGLATAKVFLSAGAQVAITGRNPQALQVASSALLAEHPDAIVLALQADASNEAQMAAAAVQIRTQWGGLDVLFANAGVAFATPLSGTSASDYDRLMDANLRGVFVSVQQLVGLMPMGSSIVLNTSWLNSVGTAGLSLLSASKAAVRSLARSWSAELLAQGVRVNAVSPGAINTPIHAKTGMTPDQLAAFAAGISESIPLKRLGQAEDVAQAALFLASDASSYMLGAEIVVDGGFSQL